VVPLSRQIFKMVQQIQSVDQNEKLLPQINMMIIAVGISLDYYSNIPL